jgi:hypothetical protein
MSLGIFLCVAKIGQSPSLSNAFFLPLEGDYEVGNSVRNGKNPGPFWSFTKKKRSLNQLD